MSMQENYPAESTWDAHVHCYPADAVNDPAAWAEQQQEPHWRRLVTTGPQGWADVDTLLRTMDRDGIERVLLQGWYWENPDTARLQNQWHAEWIRAHPDRLLAFAAVHPAWKDPLAELEAARSWGACGVGECLPQVQSPTGWNDPGWSRILEWTTDAGWPVCLHVTEPVGHEYPGRISTPLDELVAVMERYERQKWILAHWGGGLPFFALNKRVRRLLPNIWFDTAASPLLYDARVWLVVCHLVGPDRILFGSDFPLLLYPRHQQVPGWSGLLDELAESGLRADELAAIRGRNLRKLLMGLD